ncbi:MAG: aldehyde dehydrogenase family protein [Planctomycetota bacterium]
MPAQDNAQCHPVLIDGAWRSAQVSGMFRAVDPKRGDDLSDQYPMSKWADAELALNAAASACTQLRDIEGSSFAAFLRSYADNIESRAEQLIATAEKETALPAEPRFRSVELPRTTNQLRLAASAAEDQSWRSPIIDTDNNLRSVLEPVGPVAIFGPNNFPFAFNSVSGGDFATAIAAGNPVIAKAHPAHPTTTRLLAESAWEALVASGLPDTSFQLLYALDRDDGLRLAQDRRLGAFAFTGSREAGVALKAEADRVGTPFFGEMSSINPVVILPGAIAERGEAIADELAMSGLMGTGQFCTSPGLVVLWMSDTSEAVLDAVARKYQASPCGSLLTAGVRDNLATSVAALIEAGAEIVCGAGNAEPHNTFKNTVLRVSGEGFLERSEDLQAEAFGNALLFVVVRGDDEAARVLGVLGGNLTGTIYASTDGTEEDRYHLVASALRPRVGRLINDKMPTGVAVSPAMNHGGPFPATGHPHFTAVGIPASLRRFTRLACYDNVPDHRLPKILAL